MPVSVAQLLSRVGVGRCKTALRCSLAFFVIKGLLWTALLLAPLVSQWL